MLVLESRCPSDNPGQLEVDGQMHKRMGSKDSPELSVLEYNGRKYRLDHDFDYTSDHPYQVIYKARP